MIFLFLWETNEAMYPSDPEERMKLIMGNVQRIKGEVENGDLMMWGISPGGGHGFAVGKADGKETFEKTSYYTRFTKFEVKPMLSIDEMMDVMKAMQK